MHRFKLFVILISVIGCSNTSDRYNFVFETYEHVSIQDVDLNQKITDLYPTDFEMFTNKNKPLGAGRVSEVINDSILIVVENYSLIKKVNLNLKKVELEKSMIGRGPGEYEKINDIVRSDSGFIVLDRERGKFLEYDSNLELLHEWFSDEINFSEHGSRIDFHNGRIYYPIRDDTTFLFSSSVLYQNQITQAFHKRFIPIGKQPRSYNEFIPRSSNSGTLVTSTFMPILFLYSDNLDLKKILRLKLKDLDKYEYDSNSENYDNGIQSAAGNTLTNPKPQILNGNKSVRLNGFKIFDTIFTDNKIVLYFSNRYIQDRYLIVLEKVNSEWIHSGSYRLYSKHDDTFTVMDMAYYEPWLYLSSQFENNIIRVNLNDL